MRWRRQARRASKLMGSVSGGHEQQGGDHNAVERRVGQGDQLLGERIARGGHDGSQQDGPCRHEHASRDQQSLDGTSQSRQQAGRGVDEAKEPGNDEHGRQQEADVTESGRNRLETEADLTARPEDLTDPPRRGPGPDQQPGAPFSSRTALRDIPTRKRPDNRRDALPDVGEGRPEGPPVRSRARVCRHTGGIDRGGDDRRDDCGPMIRSVSGLPVCHHAWS